MFGNKINGIKKLALKKTEKHAAKLATYLNDKNPEVRFAAIEALGKVGHEPAVNELSRLLHHSDAAVRIATAKALREMADARTKTHLQYQSKNEKDPAVAEAIRAALANISESN